MIFPDSEKCFQCEVRKNKFLQESESLWTSVSMMLHKHILNFVSSITFFPINILYNLISLIELFLIRW